MLNSVLTVWEACFSTPLLQKISCFTMPRFMKSRTWRHLWRLFSCRRFYDSYAFVQATDHTLLSRLRYNCDLLNTSTQLYVYFTISFRLETQHYGTVTYHKAFLLHFSLMFPYSFPLRSLSYFNLEYLQTFNHRHRILGSDRIILSWYKK